MHLREGLAESVSNKDDKVIRHLKEHFGDNMGFRINENNEIVLPCVKVNVPFRVLLPLECSFSSDGRKTGILNPGNYCILYGWKVDPVNSVCLRKLDKRDGRDRTIEDVFIAWKDDRMIDWRYVVPVKI